ncbi:MAG TPA: DnaJ domain-containing protein [Candidatus Manganitrophaceae bacterium]|nr:DnaJ domain-containing protein [Candidatus Manganitrophaceae bacterium]
MYDADAVKKLFERKRQLNRRIIELRGALQIDLAFAFEHYYEARAYTYFAIEEKIQDFEELFLKLEIQIDESDNLSDLGRTAERVAYVEDRLDELQSEIYNRPRRRRRRPFSFGDFFSQFAGQQNGNGAGGSQGEISSLAEAYQVLGLEEGVNLAGVTAAFRKFAKEYHPDARGGDRSSETQLRKVVEAYQMIKEFLEESRNRE